jgi:hypothetical protein
VENHRPDLTKLKPRMSRHWSDVAVMSTADRFKDDKLSTQMLREVIRFKQIYFAASWAHYETAVPGTFWILPNDNLAKVLQDDYAQMKEMFPVASLSFDEIPKKLETLQTRLNSLKFTP